MHVTLIGRSAMLEISFSRSLTKKCVAIVTRSLSHVMSEWVWSGLSMDLSAFRSVIILYYCNVHRVCMCVNTCFDVGVSGFRVAIVIHSSIHKYYINPFSGTVYPVYAHTQLHCGLKLFLCGTGLHPYNFTVTLYNCCRV